MRRSVTGLRAGRGESSPTVKSTRMRCWTPTCQMTICWKISARKVSRTQGKHGGARTQRRTLRHTCQRIDQPRYCHAASVLQMRSQFAGCDRLSGGRGSVCLLADRMGRMCHCRGAGMKARRRPIAAASPRLRIGRRRRFALPIKKLRRSALEEKNRARCVRARQVVQDVMPLNAFTGNQFSLRPKRV